ncbi:inositol oxygenase [Artemisia annua]|uniref:inositol oxygenase n=1 Tax=Artemisia annua TaxID=35608 RepID=A0A2U1LQP8_ARTAN|nr:inositol oxygenase [Artemisia annua]
MEEFTPGSHVISFNSPSSRSPNLLSLDIVEMEQVALNVSGSSCVFPATKAEMQNTIAAEDVPREYNWLGQLKNNRYVILIVVLCIRASYLIAYSLWNIRSMHVKDVDIQSLHPQLYVGNETTVTLGGNTSLLTSFQINGDVRTPWLGDFTLSIKLKKNYSIRAASRITFQPSENQQKIDVTFEPSRTHLSEEQIIAAEDVPREYNWLGRLKNNRYVILIVVLCICASYLIAYSLWNIRSMHVKDVDIQSLHPQLYVGNETTVTLGGNTSLLTSFQINGDVRTPWLGDFTLSIKLKKTIPLGPRPMLILRDMLKEDKLWTEVMGIVEMAQVALNVTDSSCVFPATEAEMQNTIPSENQQKIDVTFEPSRTHLSEEQMLILRDMLKEDKLWTEVMGVSMAMAAKEKLLLHELKTVKADLAFANERCGHLEEENRIESTGGHGDNPENEDLVQKMREEYKKLDKLEMSIWEFVDESDPDLDEPQIEHLLQSAEAIRKDYPNEDWLHLTALIHDLGKVLLLPRFVELPQWAVYFKENPDINNPIYQTKNGIYEEGCGLENVTISWGHDDYMYLVAKENGTTLPPAALFIIPMHSSGAYKHLMNDEDVEYLKWVQIFNKYDLYSKSKSRIDVKRSNHAIYLSLKRQVII